VLGRYSPYGPSRSSFDGADATGGARRCRSDLRLRIAPPGSVHFRLCSYAVIEESPSSETPSPPRRKKSPRGPFLRISVVRQAMFGSNPCLGHFCSYLVFDRPITRARYRDAALDRGTRWASRQPRTVLSDARESSGSRRQAKSPRDEGSRGTLPPRGRLATIGGPGGPPIVPPRGARDLCVPLPPIPSF